VHCGDMEMTHDVVGDVSNFVVIRSESCNGFVISSKRVSEIFRIAVMVRPCLSESYGSIGMYEFSKKVL